MDSHRIKKFVRERYGKIAKNADTSCCPSPSCCSDTAIADVISQSIGYSKKEISAVPDGANLGLGCGNPTALAEIKPGDVVLDLGAGAGFDCFLAAEKVGESGKVIGVDMTPEMIAKARENAEKGHYTNVEFRLGEIENLPAADASVDMVISNCVINLSPDKARIFKEAFRVLKPGGQLMISDIALLKELPEWAKENIDAYVGCVSGAILKDDYLRLIEQTGFNEVEVLKEVSFPVSFLLNDPTVQTFLQEMNIAEEEAQKIADTVVSIAVKGLKLN